MIHKKFFSPFFYLCWNKNLFNLVSTHLSAAFFSSLIFTLDSDMACFTISCSFHLWSVMYSLTSSVASCEYTHSCSKLETSRKNFFSNSLQPCTSSKTSASVYFDFIEWSRTFTKSVMTFVHCELASLV